MAALAAAEKRANAGAARMQKKRAERAAAAKEKSRAGEGGGGTAAGSAAAVAEALKKMSLDGGGPQDSAVAPTASPSCPPGIDPTTFRELPSFLQDELWAQHGGRPKAAGAAKAAACDGAPGRPTAAFDPTKALFSSGSNARATLL
jgi:hypothetical protein